MISRRMAASLAAVAFALLAAFPAAAQLKSPDKAKVALRLLVQVSNDFKRQINAKNFGRLPHEYMEYTEAADALRAATQDEPTAFKTKMETRLKAAVTAYQNVSDMSAKAPDADRLMTELGKAVTAMNGLFDLFPADLRPDPNTPPGRGGAPRN